ncbi:MAG: TetR/AcrR family transcriptional regulator [Planctomycetota bacterium]
MSDTRTPATAADARRAELVPTLARAFADLGYAGATTAALARACKLRENQLYRLWPSKKAMFLATLDYLYEMETRWWRDRLAEAEHDPAAAARAILDEEGRRRGETGLHRIIFAGLHEADDPDVRHAMAQMYQRFHKFIAHVLRRSQTPGSTATASGHGVENSGGGVTPHLGAWALIAFATFSNIARELDLFPVSTQRRLMAEAGGLLTNLPPKNKTKK